MSDHADTIRRARDVSQGLAGEFASTDPSDMWTQTEVYEFVYDPLDKHLRLLADLAVALVAERQQAIDERDEAQRGWETVKAERDTAQREAKTMQAQRDALQARCEQAIDALRVYADPRNWSVSRDDLNHRVVAWIGPGAEKAGMPDALETARAALVSLGETE